MAAHTPVRLTVRRHAESVWNAQARIQGDIASPPLTAAGAAGAGQWATGLTDDTGIRTIWSSDAARARSTAAAAGRRLGLPVTCTRLLAEVGAGVLEGLTHAEAARTLPEHHRVWEARGDLDATPGAESGDLAFTGRDGQPGRAELFDAYADSIASVHQVYRQGLTELSSRFPTAIFLDLSTVYAVEDAPCFLDGVHLTAHGADVLADALAKALGRPSADVPHGEGTALPAAADKSQDGLITRYDRRLPWPPRCRRHGALIPGAARRACSRRGHRQD
ncbi:histidine phosphatase family protein [Streptomyces sp. 1222.5]|uniref:histidine phosphatase family protein n=1 Tax=Streptomyces sp. 1222.5 TaxID=1881026 RepID=UPI003D7358D1